MHSVCLQHLILLMYAHRNIHDCILWHLSIVNTLTARSAHFTDIFFYLIGTMYTVVS